ncbi:hypothetical protein ACFQU2_04070 [Siccirubricoccus deserti]
MLPALRARVPSLLTFGDYDPATRTGPALWLRAAAARQVPGIDWPQGEPPVIYLPGHGREVLRGAEDCPADLAPLVWFAVAGTFFGQPKQARDWTLRGFLAAHGSPVRLDIPEDKATREALARAASRLFAEPVEALRGRRLTAAELDALLAPDPMGDMLRWMDGALTPDTDLGRFDAFAALATKQLGFDPRKKSPQDAAARLASKEKGWAKVWERFEQSGGGHEGWWDCWPARSLKTCSPSRTPTRPRTTGGKPRCARGCWPSRTSRAARRGRRSGTSKATTRGGGRRSGRNAARPGWRRRWRTSPLSPRPPRCLGTIPQRWRRRTRSRAGRPTRPRWRRSISSAAARTGKPSWRRCAPSICRGSTKVQRRCRRWPSTGRSPSPGPRRPSRRPPSVRCSCSWTGCAWTSRTASPRCCGRAALPSRRAGAGPAFQL